MGLAYSSHEGFIHFQSFRIWYRIVGGQEGLGTLPLLCLHGGPGATHDYLEPLEEIAAGGRRVIFYDQLGSGRSDHPHNPSIWKVSRFVDELKAVRKALGLDRVHILGQSWGGMLAMEYAVRAPRGLAGLILANAPANMRLWAREAKRLRSELPTEVQRILSQHEEAGTTHDSAYQDAMMVFYRRHVCRLDPWPDCLERTFEAMNSDPEVYHTMIGPSEFHITGILKDWDISDLLGNIRVPTLVLSGRYDEATPAIAGAVHRGIPGSGWVLFENSSHMPHLEERAKYLKIVNDFLVEVETRLHYG